MWISRRRPCHPCHPNASAGVEVAVPISAIRHGGWTSKDNSSSARPVWQFQFFKYLTDTNDNATLATPGQFFPPPGSIASILPVSSIIIKEVIRDDDGLTDYNMTIHFSQNIGDAISRAGKRHKSGKQPSEAPLPAEPPPESASQSAAPQATAPQPTAPRSNRDGKRKVDS